MRFSPDGTHLVSLGNGITLWDVQRAHEPPDVTDEHADPAARIHAEAARRMAEEEG